MTAAPGEITLLLQKVRQGDPHAPGALWARLYPELHRLDSLGQLYRRQGKYAQAEPLFHKVVEVQRRVLEAEHPRRLGSMNDLALLYLSEGKYVPAEAVLRRPWSAIKRL